MPQLGVNIDHVATIRQARQTYEPDPVWAASLAELGGADCITIHLREDRRHIQDRDLLLLKETVHVKLNLELACVDEVLALACETRPHQATLVPERREEVTTEGGLDVAGRQSTIGDCAEQLRQAGVSVSLFLDPDPQQLRAAAALPVDAVELHTGQYSLAEPGPPRAAALEKLCAAAEIIREQGWALHAGHGLNYQNVGPVAAMADMAELNIGHAIVSRAVMVGMERAVREMKLLL